MRIILCYKNNKGENIIFQNKSYRLLLLGTLLGFLIPNLVQASGFALIENSASGQGNAYAGAAAHAVDGSTVWFNPAGMMKLDRDQLVFAGHIVSPNASFTNNGSTASALLGSVPLTGADDDGGVNAFVPNFYWVKTINEVTKFGLGITAPFGLATKYNDDWVGRYHGVVSDLKTVNFNPSIGYRVNDKLSIGGGLDLMLGTVELSSAIDFGAICVGALNQATCDGLGSIPQQSDGFADLKSDNYDSVSIGFNFGLLYEISNQTNIGVTYRSEIDMETKGDANFTVPSSASFVFANNAFIDTGLKAEVALPASFSLSVSHQRNKITYLADISWTGWSSFKELRIEYDNPAQPDSVTTYDWDDTFRYSFGIDYQFSDQIILRTGIAFDETPVPSPERRTPRLPGNDRKWLSFGLGYLYSKNISFDFGYSHLFVDDSLINNEFESSIPTLAATLKGEYEASVDILSAQLNWLF
jgi:long-chain fatty acid transport protein